MKIFLVGEGPTDCGWPEYQEREGRYVWQDGPVQIYIRKIMRDAEIEATDKAGFSTIAKERKKRNRRAMQGIKGHGDKAFIISSVAKERGFDVAAMYVDGDKEQGSTQKDTPRCRKRYEEVSGQVKEGLLRGGADQYLAIVPMKMIECWLLGDPKAFKAAFKTDVPGKLLNNPELLWGDEHNPESDYPKNRLSKVLKLCNQSSSREIYSEIASHSDVETLSANCPISFADFAQQMQALH